MKANAKGEISTAITGVPVQRVVLTNAALMGDGRFCRPCFGMSWVCRLTDWPGDLLPHFLKYQRIFHGRNTLYPLGQFTRLIDLLRLRNRSFKHHCTALCDHVDA